MRDIEMFIGVMVVPIIGLAVILPVVTEIGKDVNISKTLGGSPVANRLFQLIPLFVAIGILLFVVSSFMSLGGLGSSSEDDDESEEEETEEEEQKQDEPSEQSDRTKQELMAEKILKKRHARGEITTEEYDERMSHL